MSRHTTRKSSRKAASAARARGRARRDVGPKDERTDKERPDGPRDQEWPDPNGPRPAELLKDYPLPSRRGDERGRTHYTPFIVLRHSGTDTGARPLAPGTPFWHSPDVFVSSSAGANVPTAGEENRIFARVNNWGIKDAAGVVIRYWWANPSLAITEANGHLIGMATAFVPASYSVIVECPTPWIPIIENGGHECVFAEAWVPTFDPIVAPLDPVVDRHVCQRNLHVIEVEVGDEFSLDVEAVNLVGGRAQVTFHVQSLSARSAQMALTARDLAYRGRMVMKAGALPLSLELSTTARTMAAPNQVHPRRQLAWAKLAADGGRQDDCRPLGTMARAVTLEPWEMRTLTISGRVPTDAVSGQLFAFDLSQRIDDVVTGGYVVYVVAKSKNETHDQ